MNNVSSLTSHELASILATAEPVCLRVMHEADGTPITADTPRWRRLKLSLRRAAAGFAAMLVAHPIAGCAGRDDGATVGHVMNRNLQSSLAASSMDRESQAQMAASLRKQIEQSAEAID